MAFQHTQFFNPLPELSDPDWFSLNEREDDDLLLTNEENEYKLMMKEIADKGYDLLSIGETKNGSEIAGDEDLEEDEESAEVIDDETDDYDGVSPDTGAVNLNQEF
ncbi:anaphase-promoting complex subunit 15B-like isoform X2 [Xenia sp. Carnegie-2017]|uniref:anaphase-promoting complex subunit 15B-like isoform X2 n=1 Tax=Xenia sp. Carnegie-2017 TaxID=2897299 RepID=UPI001F03D53D|nr:anaphase-promoting complex subunit 15B-like isoform X2 [Xenia sp. Carnegie-2017]